MWNTKTNGWRGDLFTCESQKNNHIVTTYMQICCAHNNTESRPNHFIHSCKSMNRMWFIFYFYKSTCMRIQLIVYICNHNGVFLELCQYLHVHLSVLWICWLMLFSQSLEVGLPCSLSLLLWFIINIIVICLSMACPPQKTPKQTIPDLHRFFQPFFIFIF